jgi:triacylglycerol esterase/lipase EstA (alpha/beta hydrolase family)
MCMIGHSIGGLVIKEMIYQDEVMANEFQPVTRAIRSVVFLATPHDGAGLATLASHIGLYRASTASRDLEKDSDHLLELGNCKLPRVAQAAVRGASDLACAPG